MDYLLSQIKVALRCCVRQVTEELVMSGGIVLKLMAEGESPLIDVVFIHGLTGSPIETWISEDDEDFWPRWLQEDLNRLNIYTLGYPASLTGKWSNKEMNLFERAITALELFAAKGIGNRPIVFVTHSLGGLLAKIIIRSSCQSDDKDYVKVAKAVRQVFFLATPHTGATLAKIGKVIPGASSHIAVLANETGFLEDLNNHYRNFSNERDDLSTKIYYEKFKTGNAAIVVSKESADPGLGIQATALDKDHLNICKPQDRDDIVYLSISRHISNLLDDLKEDSQDGEVKGTDYQLKSELDRRDLLQKLIDADREHEYGYANDAQSTFARVYRRLGLFDTAKQDYDELLAEVETRFIAHVFHPLICSGANDEAIRDAIQNKVIDPLSLKQMGKSKFSAKSVWEALYFLTEQCHLKWDYKA